MAGWEYADLAQLVEQLIRNEQVVGSSPIIGSKEKPLLLSKRGFSFFKITLFYLYLLAVRPIAQHIQPSR
jgi:hypothetical protein